MSEDADAVAPDGRYVRRDIPDARVWLCLSHGTQVVEQIKLVRQDATVGSRNSLNNSNAAIERRQVPIIVPGVAVDDERYDGVAMPNVGDSIADE